MNWTEPPGLPEAKIGITESIQRQLQHTAQRVRAFARREGALVRNFGSLSALQALNYLLPLVTVPYSIWAACSEQRTVIHLLADTNKVSGLGPAT